jgi:pantetheine-phosphate adenylyltransferase
MYTVGMVTGSFDPITRGHEWMAERACKTFDKVFFAIAYNPDKKGMFSIDERLDLSINVMESVLAPQVFNKLDFITVEKKFTVRVAKEHGVTTIMRGIRNPIDFAYEKDIQGFNNDIEPSIDHVFVIPPETITRISSSAVRGFVGIHGWENTVSRYVHPIVLEALKAKCAKSM